MELGWEGRNTPLTSPTHALWRGSVLENDGLSTKLKTFDIHSRTIIKRDEFISRLKPVSENGPAR